MSSLATFRDALLLAHYQKIIDDVEFAVLYDADLSKPVFPYSKFDRFSLDNWEDSESINQSINKLYLPSNLQCSTLTAGPS